MQVLYSVTEEICGDWICSMMRNAYLWPKPKPQTPCNAMQYVELFYRLVWSNWTKIRDNLSDYPPCLRHTVAVHALPSFLNAANFALQGIDFGIQLVHVPR